VPLRKDGSLILHHNVGGNTFRISIVRDLISGKYNLGIDYVQSNSKYSGWEEFCTIEGFKSRGEATDEAFFIIEQFQQQQSQNVFTNQLKIETYGNWSDFGYALRPDDV